MSQSTNSFKKGDAVLVSDAALIYSGLSPEGTNDTRVGLVIRVENARSTMDLDNDDNLVETLLPDGTIEWIWEQDLIKLSS